jgi:hypothetical protein
MRAQMSSLPAPTTRQSAPTSHKPMRAHNEVRLECACNVATSDCASAGDVNTSANAHAEQQREGGAQADRLQERPDDCASAAVVNSSADDDHVADAGTTARARQGTCVRIVARLMCANTGVDVCADIDNVRDARAITTRANIAAYASRRIADTTDGSSVY